MKKVVKLNERELNRMISESVKRVLNEEYQEKYQDNIPQIVYNFIREHDIVNDLNSEQPEDIYEYIWDIVDSQMIYYKDQWELLMAYTTPQHLNENSLSEAFEEFINDIITVVENQ